MKVIYLKDLLPLLQDNINKDRALQYTSVGTHKDDLSFEIGHPLRSLVQENKIILIALKLAQFEFLKKQSGVSLFYCLMIF
jgi:DNA replication and repair protein RecF